MKFRVLIAVGLCLGAAWANGQITGPVVNGDFNAIEIGGPSATYSGQGVLIDTGNDFWNSLDVPLGFTSTITFSDLTASDGSTGTTIDITINDIQNAFDLDGFFPDPLIAPDLLNDYVLTQNPTLAGPVDPISYTIDGLTPGQAYQFIFFSQPGGYTGTDHNAVFTLEELTQPVTAFNPLPTFALGLNYAQFVYVPLGTTVSGTFFAGPLSIEADWNGFQIAPIAPIPEPETWVVGILAAIVVGMSVVRRRRLSARA